MQPSAAIPLACFLSMIRPPGVEFENSYLQLLPIDKAKCPFVRSTNDVGFWLYTKNNPTVYEELFIGDDKRLKASHLDFKDHTVLYFHAFLENPESGSALMMREAYILRGDTNVIMIDAQRLEAGPWYFTAAENTWFIGQYAARFIDYLVSRGLDLSKTHLVGHSLGAQAAGVAGYHIKSGRVTRITGLDPALPLFEKLPLEQKLDPSDADFVDVIHTDAGIFGVNHPLGHVDFYPNGGISPQPGCELEVLWPRQMILEKFFCSHWRSYQFFTESVLRPQSFVASQCKSWKDFKKGKCRDSHLTHMGHSVDRKEHIEKHPPKGYYAFELKTVHADAKLNKHYGYSKKERYTKREPHKTIPINTRHTKKDLSTTRQIDSEDDRKNRKRRFASLFQRQDDTNFIFRMLDFLVKNRKNVLPVVSVVREINTLVKSANGELSHSSKERNNFVGTPAQLPAPLAFTLELGNESKAKAFLKRLLGLGTKTDKLTIAQPGGLFG